MKPIFFFALFILLNKPAHAYIDAGIGSMLIQGIVVGFAVGLFYIKNIFKTVKNFFLKEKSPQNDN